MTRRWIRLDAEWEESGWIDALPGDVSGCWPKLLAWVKLRGKAGRCRRPASPVLARRWKVSVEVVECLLMAAVHDEAIAYDGDDMIVMNWKTYQEPDPTAAERKRQQRAREESERHGDVTAVTRDIDKGGRDPSRDPQPPTLELQYSSDFEAVWSVCRRGSKRQALHQYRRAVPAKVTHEALLLAWKAHVSAAREPQYVKHLERWIRDERWLEAPATKNGNGSHPREVPVGNGSAARYVR